jgi:hypothetical protein
MGTGSFAGVKRPWPGVEHLPLFSAEVRGRVELFFWILMACFGANLTFLKSVGVPGAKKKLIVLNTLFEIFQA